MAQVQNDSYEGTRMNILISVLPSVFALLLILLLVIMVSKVHDRRKDNKATDEPRDRRLALLNKKVKAEQFVVWTRKEQERRPGLSFSDPLCVICLEEFQDASQIRGLKCHHVFHQECLDDWFALLNDYCPLCHGPIIPGTKKAIRQPEPNPQVPIAFVVF